MKQSHLMRFLLLVSLVEERRFCLKSMKDFDLVIDGRLKADNLASSQSKNALRSLKSKVAVVLKQMGAARGCSGSQLRRPEKDVAAVQLLNQSSTGNMASNY